MKKKGKRLLIVFCLLLTVLTTYVYADEEQPPQEQNQEQSQEPQELLEDHSSNMIHVKAKVVEAGEVYEEQNGDVKETVQKVKIKVLEGEYKNKEYEATYILSYDLDGKILAYELRNGNTVFAQLTQEEGVITKASVGDVVRQNYVLLMIAVFFVLILLIGKKQGLKAILALIVTIVIIYVVMIGSIYKGHSPVLMSVVSSILIIIITFLIISGFNKKSFTAVLGTAGGVLSAGFMAFLFGFLAQLSGGQEEAVMLSISAQNISFNFRELLFAGIVISSLGAAMDVGMSIASALDELKQKNPEMTWKEIFKSGMNIGGDVIGTMTNTLILAYVGSSLTLILLFMSSNMSLTDIINKETIASEAISAIAGSMGVICTVPITAFVYAFLNRNKSSYKTKSDNLLEGKRSLKLK